MIVLIVIAVVWFFGFFCGWLGHEIQREHDDGAEHYDDGKGNP